MARGSFAWRRLTEYFDETRDAFGNAVTRNTRNNADLASHYRYTPERWRLYKNGSRATVTVNGNQVPVHYDVDASTDIEDKRAGDEDVYVLTPSAGDTLQLKSAERFRYTVNYVSEVSKAFVLNQALANPDDRVTVGLDTSPDGDLADGYYLEHLPTHEPAEVDLYVKRKGNIVGDRQTITLQRDTTNFQRFENDYNWYNVGQTKWTESVSLADDEGGSLRNFLLGALSALKGDANAGTGGRGPISGNGHIVYEVEADASTTGLELHCGSVSFTTLGGVGASIKAKGAETDAIDVTQTAGYEPLFAMRVDPDRPNVNAQIRGVETTQGTGKLNVIACNSSEVLDASGNELVDSGFARPVDHSGQNSVIEVTNGSYVAEFPNSTGATVTTAANPGGYQLGFDTTRQTQGGKTERSGDLQEKHGINDGDLAVFLAHPDDANTDFRVFHQTEMDE